MGRAREAKRDEARPRKTVKEAQGVPRPVQGLGDRLAGIHSNDNDEQTTRIMLLELPPSLLRPSAAVRSSLAEPLAIPDTSLVYPVTVHCTTASDIEEEGERETRRTEWKASRASCDLHFLVLGSIPP